MTLNCIWWCVSCPGTLGNVECLFIAVTLDLEWKYLLEVTSMGQIELFNHLTVSKRMTDVKLYCLCYKAMIEPLYCVQMKLLVLDWNT